MSSELDTIQSWWPATQDLVERWRAKLGQPLTSEQSQGLSALGVPLQELCFTPLSAQISLRAAMRGRGFFHHELRGGLPVPEHMAPDPEVWDGNTMPTWASGVRVEPKYFSFFQENPLSAYNPNYRGKWRAHELCHGLMGIYWHPQLTRFALYLAARLNELLPVVHWYGWDECFRAKCDKHRHQGPQKDFCMACEQHACAYWEIQDVSAQDVAYAEQMAERSRLHFWEEWDICVREWSSGTRIESPRGYLNASSDAMGYVRGHWERLTSWSFGAWHEMFLQEGVDTFRSIEALMQHQLGVCRTLLLEDIDFSYAQSQGMRQRSLIQDLGYRTLILLEHFSETSSVGQRAERIIMPVLEEMGTHAKEILSAPANPVLLQKGTVLLSTWVAEVCTAFPAMLEGIGARQQMLLSPGILWSDAREVVGPAFETLCKTHATQLREGLDSVVSWVFLPEALEAEMLEHTPQAHEAFVHSDAFLETGRLIVRWSKWLQQQPHLHEHWKQMLDFVAWSQAEPRKDREAEDFGGCPESLEQLEQRRAELRHNQTLRIAEWPLWLVTLVCAERPEFEEQEQMDAWLLQQFDARDQNDEATRPIAVIYHQGELKLLP
ncbi:MAG: hypothetical protein AAGJ35_03910, partial [Myxococcota bacterium]